MPICRFPSLLFLIITVILASTHIVQAQAEFKFTANDGAAGDVFGFAASISGNYALVGAPDEDENGADAGAAYVFQHLGAAWVQVAKLTANDGAAGDAFGGAVALSGDYAVVGASRHNGSFGAGYIFQRVGSNWNHVVKLTAADALVGIRFGQAVAIDGDYVIVGAFRDDDKGADAGAAYIFQRSGNNWDQVKKLTANDGAAGDHFGAHSVSIDGEYVVVAAVQDDDNGADSGSAYIFKRENNIWTQAAKLTASDAAEGDRFGLASISGDHVLIGANTNDDHGNESGAAYIFKRENDTWTETAKLTASDAAAGDNFGGNVALSGNLALIAAAFDDDNGNESGSAYIFKQEGTIWNQLVKLKPTDGSAGDFFGSTAIDGNDALIGAFRDDDNGVDSGSAYVFDLSGLVTFTDVTTTAGVSDGGAGRGVAWGDYDNDGDLDLYLAKALGANKLFRNEGNGTFTEVGGISGVNDEGNGRGVAWGDYDNDGDLDLFLSKNGSNRLYRNDGDGTFTTVTTNADVDESSSGIDVAWGDFDNDGDLDLFRQNQSGGSGVSSLYSNDNDGTFTEVAAAAQVANSGGSGSGVGWGDYDNDGDLDLYLIVDVGTNLLFRNDSDGTFTDVAAIAGVDDNGDSYSFAWGDYDNDGDLDLYQGNNGANRLYRNNGNGTFTDVGNTAGVDDSGFGNGVMWGDYDSDGHLDLYVSNDNSPNLLYHNNGDGTFNDVAGTVGVNDSGPAGGLTFGDYDNDGDLDLYMGSDNGTNKLYRNNGTPNRWLHLKLIGTESNRDGIGARVRAVTGNMQQRRDVDGGGGSLSQPSLPVEFGFGSTTMVDSIIVHWPSGITQILTNISTNQALNITEPTGTISIIPNPFNFGSIVTGNSTSNTFEIENTGSSDILISDISLTNNTSAFSIVQPTAPIGPGGDSTITIRFSPQQVGSFSDTLVIIHNAIGSPSIIPLSGTGLAAIFNTVFFDDFENGNADNWTWTGDSRGGGDFIVENGIFKAVNTGHRNYVLKNAAYGPAIYEFDGLFPNCAFAFRITTSDSLAGTAVTVDFETGVLRLRNPISWTTLAFENGQFMWPNGSFQEESFPLDIASGWHHFTIIDQDSLFTIVVDQDTVLTQNMASYPPGYIGIGGSSNSIGGVAFDNIRVSEQNGVAPTSVFLSSGKSFGAPGDTLRIPATLTTPSAIGGLQFTVRLEDLTHAHFLGLEDTLSNPGFTVSSTAAGDSTRLVIFSASGATLQPGTDIPLATLVYVLDESAILGSTIGLTNGNAQLGDSLGIEVSATLVNGALQVGIRGDVNLDADVSILDIIQLVRIIIGRETSPEAGSTAFNIADANADGTIDIVDVIYQVNKALGVLPKTIAFVPSSPVLISLDVPHIQPDGQTVIPVSMETDGLVSGAQLTFVYNPDALTIGTPRLANESTDLTIDSYVSDGTLKVVVYGVSPGTGLKTGSLLHIPIEAIEASTDAPTLALTDVILVNSAAQRIETVTGASEVIVRTASSPPMAFALEAARPNPFNPSTTIFYQVAEKSHITLTIYNLLGQEVVRLVDKIQTPGRHQAVWNGINKTGKGVSSGVYLYRIFSSSGYTDTKRMTLLK